jgi:hypothetical protein
MLMSDSWHSVLLLMYKKQQGRNKMPARED